MYWMYKFYKTRETLIIRKRKPSLVMLSYIPLWTFWIIVISANLIVQPEIMNADRAETSGDIVNDFIGLPFLFIYVAINASRFWLIFYMINYNAAVINNQWQSVIDPTNSDKNWYMQHKEKLGTWISIRKWVIIYALIPYLIVTISRLFRRFAETNSDIYGLQYDLGEDIHGQLRSFVHGIFGFVFPLILFVYILCKIPKYHDNIGIRKELIWTIYANICIFIVNVAWIIYTYLPFEDKTEKIAIPIYYAICRATFTIPSYIATRLPLKTFDEILDRRVHDSWKLRELVHRKTFNELQLIQDMKDDDPKNTDQENVAIVNRKALKQTLKTEDLFDAFMNHLFGEYCAECLLSIVEFIQFKNKIIRQNEDIQFEINEIQLPRSFIKSSIVNQDMDYKDIADRLYNKYIRAGSEWEINIDYGNRKRYKDLFEHGNESLSSNDIQEFYSLFDPCIEAMIHLIMPAFARFRNGKQYQMIQRYAPPVEKS